MATIEAPSHEARTEPQPPYQSYAAIMGVFAGGLGLAGLLGHALGRDPQCQTPLDLALLSAATFKASRTLAREGRGRTRSDADPRPAVRMLTWSLASAGVNDFLQAGFAALANKSNELGQRAES